MRWQDRIGVDPNVCHGKPCIRGTRVLVSVVLADVAAGDGFESIMIGYHITREDIRAALLFAADQELLELAERAERVDALRESIADMRAGIGIPAEEMLGEMRQILADKRAH